LTRRHRLRGPAAFAAVLRRGQRFEGERLQLVALPAVGAGCVGYVIGKKLLPRAVDRNRLKRMLRETLRARRPAVNAFDLVLRLRRPCAATDIAAAVAEASALLGALGSRSPGQPR
jgi:ribonuclease P protein component